MNLKMAISNISNVSESSCLIKENQYEAQDWLERTRQKPAVPFNVNVV